MSKKGKFTPARKKALIEMLTRSVPVGIACDKLGINRTTYYLWKKKAETYDPLDETTAELKEYHLFFERIYQARAESFQTILSEIMTMGVGYETEEVTEEYTTTEDGERTGETKTKKTIKTVRHPSAMMFLAERLFPDILGNRMKLDIEGLNELILREMARSAGRSESNTAEGTAGTQQSLPGGKLAGDSGTDQPEDWENLPA